MSQVLLPPLPPIDRAEALRYAGARENDTATLALFDALTADCPTLRAAVCCDCFPITVLGGAVQFPFVRVESRDLAEQLACCDRAVLFGATLGIAFDRWLMRLASVSPARALLAEGLGSERIEALCDSLEEWLRGQYRQLSPRFSPGYGDLPLSFQRDIFAVLNCEKQIGLHLTEQLLMTPRKSVTAVIGIKNEVIS